MITLAQYVITDGSRWIMRNRNGKYVPLTESQKADFVKQFGQYLNSSWNSYKPK